MQYLICEHFIRLLYFWKMTLVFCNVHGKVRGIVSILWQMASVLRVQYTFKEAVLG
jgi:uncharacterized membrane protein